MKNLFVALLFASTCVLSAVELKNNQWDKKARPSQSDPAALAISSKVVIYSLAAPYIPVDPAKKYCLSGKFRLAKPLAAKPGKLKFGIQTYDKNKRPILSEHTTVVNRTATTLVSDAEYGQRKVTVANGKLWRIMPNFSHIAFGAKDDLSDLPNRSVVAITAIKQLPDGKAELTLKEVLREFHAAGSKVRLHHRLSAFLYGGALNKVLDTGFKEFSGVFTGEQHGVAHNIFRKGTAFIQVVVMLEGAGILEFKDIKFEEVP
jgi:hypothetical protein